MKRIRPATVTVSVAAVLVGLLAAYAVRRYFEPNSVDNRVAIVAPRINLPPYARIREQDIEVIRVAPNQVPAGALTNPSQALYRLVRTTVMAGQPVLEEQLFEVGKVPTLAEQLPPGHRAVTVAVDAGNAVNGVLLPESRVDVSLTVRGEQPELGGVSTLTLLRGIRVLATDRDRFKTEERLGQGLRNITVAVSPEQANKLILAQRYGTLSVTLCSELEPEQLAAQGDNHMVSPEDLLGFESLSHKAEIWRGASVDTVTFNTAQVREAHEATIARQRQHRSPAVPASYEAQPNFTPPPTAVRPGAAPRVSIETPPTTVVVPG